MDDIQVLINSCKRYLIHYLNVKIGTVGDSSLKLSKSSKSDKESLYQYQSINWWHNHAKKLYNT